MVLVVGGGWTNRNCCWFSFKEGNRHLHLVLELKEERF